MNGRLNLLTEHRHSPRQRTSRSGTSLIETVVTISVASTLFLLATAWIHQSFFVASKMRDQGRHHDNLMRLSRQFRDDVHAATSAEMIADANVRLSSPSGSIEYQVNDNMVSRATFHSGDASAVARESFGLLDGADVACELNDDWITLTVTRTRGQRSTAMKPDEPTRPSDLHVRVRIGRWFEQLQSLGDSP